MVNRIESLESILDLHILKLSEKRADVMLNDSKQLTELLKAVQLLDTIKRLEGTKSIFDDMEILDLEAALDNE